MYSGDIGQWQSTGDYTYQSPKNPAASAKNIENRHSLAGDVQEPCQSKKLKQGEYENAALKFFLTCSLIKLCN